MIKPLRFCIAFFVVVLVIAPHGSKAVEPVRFKSFAERTGFSAQDLENFQRTLSDAALRNWSGEIDSILGKSLSDAGVPPNPIVSDEVFLRRAYLSIVGRVPTVDEAMEFLESTASSKRSALVNELSESDGFEHVLFGFYADLLRLKTGGRPGNLEYHFWLKDAVEKNYPFNRMVFAMLAANGNATDQPAVGYYLRDRNMVLDNVSNTMQTFLGMQIGCAQCHDDPFNETTQMDYYKLAAFSGGLDFESDNTRERLTQIVSHYADRNGIEFNSRFVGKKMRTGERNKAKPNQVQLKDFEDGVNPLFSEYARMEIVEKDKALKLPHDYQYDDGDPGDVVAAETLYGDRVDPSKFNHPREAFAAWVVSEDNSRFSRTLANRLWKKVYGYGLVEPADDWDEDRDVSNPELVALLERIVVESRYNAREVLRVLYHTKLFEREVSLEEVAMGSDYDFRGPVLRRMSAEQLFDSLRTLSHGEIDDRVNERLREKYRDYRKGVQIITEASVEDVLAFNEVRKEHHAKKGEGFNSMMDQKKMDLKEARRNKDEELAKRLGAEVAFMKQNPGEVPGMSDVATYAKALTATSLNVNTQENLLRASEIPGPFLGGSFVRDFGGSDRNTVNAGHTKPSIPQLLTLLNGDETEKISEPKGILIPTVMKSGDGRQRLETLFLKLYSCYPTEKEREALEPHMKSSNGVSMVARAMLSSKRFFFVQ